MNPLSTALLVFSISGVHFLAQPASNPPAIAKMEELGTVYITYAAPKAGTKADSKKGAIVGIDFRPMAGSDPKKVAEAVKGLSALPDVETVLLLGPDVTDAAVEAIPATTKLMSIQFFNTKVSDAGIAKLTRFKSLHTFKYTGMNLSDQGMRELAKIKTLHTIEITDAKVTDEGVMALQALPNLLRLTIENTAATQQSIDQLSNRLPRIEGRRFLR